MSRLDDLKSAFNKSEEQQSYSNENYPFWQMKDGEQAIIRFLPDQDESNPLGFIVEKLMHRLTINGKQRSVPCLKMYGEKECPICALSAQYYNNDDKVSGKRYYRNKQHLARALIVSDPLPPNDDGETHEGKVRTITLSYQIFEAINQAFQSGDLDDVPYDFKEGCNFIIKKKVTKDGDKEYASYVYSGFARKVTDIATHVDDMEDIQLADLSSFLPDRLEADRLEELLQADMTGGDVDEGSNSNETSNESDEDKLAKMKAGTKSETKPTSEPEAADSDIEDEADAIMKEILEGRQ